MTSVMILGGCGFIGRNLVEYFVKQEAVERIVVCDKSRPELSWLTHEQMSCFNSPKVKFKQINLANESTANAFLQENACEYVINAAAETRLKMMPKVYEENVYKLGLICAKAAVQMKAKKFVQISSARIKGIKTDSVNETSCSSHQIANYQAKLETGLATINDLNYTILRPALVYGSGDKRGLTPFIILAALYKYLKEELTILWTEDIRINTVHVSDVVSACAHCLTLPQSGDMYEVGDKANSTQGTIVKTVTDIFKVKYRFLSRVENHMAKKFFSQVVEEVNQKHLQPWSDACAKESIVNTPLSAYLNEEQIMVEEVIVDGTAIESTGFVYKFPKLSSEELLKVIKEYVDQKLFPTICAP